MSDKRLPTRVPYSVPDDEDEGMSDEDINRLDRANQGLDGFKLDELSPAALAYTKAYYKKHGITETA